MWHWIKRWRDLAMNELLPLQRISLPQQALHASYEKAGLVLHDPAVPWNAEAVLVEALVRLPAAARRKADFQLRLPGRDPVAAESLRREEADDRHRVFFRITPPGHAATAELTWKGHVLSKVNLPYLPAEDFLTNLRLQMPTLFVRLGERSVAAQTFVANQCKGLYATAVLKSPTSLAPLVDLGLRVEFRSERDGTVQDVPVPLSSTQLRSKEAVVTVAPRRIPRRIGSWTATWKVGGQAFATQRVRAISQRAFQRSLRVADTRFVVATPKEGLQLHRQVPALAEVTRIGPCFLVCSREPGMAGVCKLEIFAQVPGSVQPPVLLSEEVLITDGPTTFAPGTLDSAELGQVTAFELRLKGSALGVLSLCPVPAAAFTTEGGFKPPPDFAWTGAAEEELLERLNRLMDGPGRAN
jgi:hypothetical protein